MTYVNCNAATCIHFKNGVCTADHIELIDFEYYESLKAKKDNIIDDEMKCGTYELNEDWGNEY